MMYLNYFSLMKHVMKKSVSIPHTLNFHFIFLEKPSEFRKYLYVNISAISAIKQHEKT